MNYHKEIQELIEDLFTIWRIAKYTKTDVGKALSIHPVVFSEIATRGKHRKSAIIAKALAEFAKTNEKRMKERLAPTLHSTLENCHQRLNDLVRNMTEQESLLTSPLLHSEVTPQPNRETENMTPADQNTSVEIVVVGLKEKQTRVLNAQQRFFAKLSAEGVQIDTCVVTFDDSTSARMKSSTTRVQIVVLAAKKCQSGCFTAYQTLISEFGAEGIQVDEQRFTFIPVVTNDAIPSATSKVKREDRETATSRAMNALLLSSRKTRTEISALLHITQGQVTRYKKGEHEMKPETAQRILAKLEALEQKPPEEVLNLFRALACADLKGTTSKPMPGR